MSKLNLGIIGASQGGGCENDAQRMACVKAERQRTKCNN